MLKKKEELIGINTIKQGWQRWKETMGLKRTNHKLKSTMIKLKENNNFYVLTGGPGVGKTTLLEELERRNYEIVPEIARELIKEQQKTNGQALPWKDKELY